MNRDDSRAEELRRGQRNVLTPHHEPENYPGLKVVRLTPRWSMSVLVPEDGDTIHALGGERTLSYETIDGGYADGFELRPGDRATLVRSGLPFAMVEWRIERANDSLGQGDTR